MCLCDAFSNRFTETIVCCRPIKNEYRTTWESLLAAIKVEIDQKLYQLLNLVTSVSYFFGYHLSVSPRPSWWCLVRYCLIVFVFLKLFRKVGLSKRKNCNCYWRNSGEFVIRLFGFAVKSEGDNNLSAGKKLKTPICILISVIIFHIMIIILHINNIMLRFCCQKFKNLLRSVVTWCVCLRRFSRCAASVSNRQLFCFYLV